MDTCDVLIVGGGPAGSACAWKLRQAGVDVAVLDRATFPRHKVCAGWITPPIVVELNIDVADYQRRHILQPITRFLTGMIGSAEVETKYDQPVSYGIRRCEFDDYLLRRSGARLWLGEPFQSLRRDGTDWIINDTYRSRIVVGAGGHFCPVSRCLDAMHSSDQSSRSPEDSRELPVVMAQEIEFEMTDEQQQQCSVMPDRPELLFCPDLKGYGWVFRKGNFINIGLGREAESHLSAHVSKFIDYLRSRGKVTFPIAAKFQGHAYYLRTKLRIPPTEPGMLLIGDALGLADRQSGEGIRPAIESGLLSADSIIEARRGDVTELSTLYQQKLRSRFGSIKSRNSVTDWIPASTRQLAARWLMSTRWFTRHVLLDQWFLHRADLPLKSA